MLENIHSIQIPDYSAIQMAQIRRVAKRLVFPMVAERWIFYGFWMATLFLIVKARKNRLFCLKKHSVTWKKQNGLVFKSLSLAIWKLDELVQFLNGPTNHSTFQILETTVWILVVSGKRVTSGIWILM